MKCVHEEIFTGSQHSTWVIFLLTWFNFLSITNKYKFIRKTETKLVLQKIFNKMKVFGQVFFFLFLFFLDGNGSVHFVDSVVCFCFSIVFVWLLILKQSTNYIQITKKFKTLCNKFTFLFL